MQAVASIPTWFAVPGYFTSEKPVGPRVSISSPEADLIAASLDGSENAFRILVERFMDEVSRTVIGMLGPVAEVDDVVQEVFIKLHKTLSSFRGDSSLKTFVIRMAINKSLDALRKRKRARWLLPWTLVENAEPAASNRSDENIHLSERNRALRMAIDRLPHTQRTVVVLRLIDELSTEETSRILDVPYGTILSRLKRGLDRLKLELGDEMVVK